MPGLGGGRSPGGRAAVGASPEEGGQWAFPPPSRTYRLNKTLTRLHSLGVLSVDADQVIVRRPEALLDLVG